MGGSLDLSLWDLGFGILDLGFMMGICVFGVVT